MHFKCSFCLLVMKFFAVVTASTVLTTPPFSSYYMQMKVLPRLCRGILVDSPSILLFSNSWYLALRLLAVLSPKFKWGWNFPNFLTVTPGSCKEAYFPMTYYSSSENLLLFCFCLLIC